jgi:DNA-binding NarL/FixJ family response regulator
LTEPPDTIVIALEIDAPELKERLVDLIGAIPGVRLVPAGEAADVAIALPRTSALPDPDPALTPREREVLELMAEGRSNNGIAERMVVTERAVEKHVTSIFGKLNLPPAAEDHRRVLAVLAYLGN